ncbi:MAG: arsenate reductase family protein [Sumerlaeia bacterium]
MAKVTFYYKPKCQTCKKTQLYLEELGHELDLRDLEQYPPPRSLLETHIDAKNVKAYLNVYSTAYRDHGLKDDPPTKKGAIELMMRDPGLIKRPVTVKGKSAVFGFDEQALKDL